MSTLAYGEEWAEGKVWPRGEVPRLICMTEEWVFDETIPKSVQIATEIEKRIRTGTYQPKRPVYEVRIVEEFGVARETARKAVAILRDRGLVRTVRGMGSFVTSPSSWAAPESEEPL